MSTPVVYWVGSAAFRNIKKRLLELRWFLLGRKLLMLQPQELGSYIFISIISQVSVALTFLFSSVVDNSLVPATSKITLQFIELQLIQVAECEQWFRMPLVKTHHLQYSLLEQPWQFCPLPKIPGLFPWLVLARNYSSRQPGVVTLDWKPRIAQYGYGQMLQWQNPEKGFVTSPKAFHTIFASNCK